MNCTRRGSTVQSTSDSVQCFVMYERETGFPGQFRPSRVTSQMFRDRSACIITSHVRLNRIALLPNPCVVLRIRKSCYIPRARSAHSPTVPRCLQRRRAKLRSQRRPTGGKGGLDADAVRILVMFHVDDTVLHFLQWHEVVECRVR